MKVDKMNNEIELLVKLKYTLLTEEEWDGDTWDIVYNRYPSDVYISMRHLFFREVGFNGLANSNRNKFNKFLIQALCKYEENILKC